jgi:hypothetical protein
MHLELKKRAKRFGLTGWVAFRYAVAKILSRHKRERVCKLVVPITKNKNAFRFSGNYVPLDIYRT